MIDREESWAQDMRAANAGDATAYRRLLTELAAALRALIRRKLFTLKLDANDAEDIVQDALLAIHLKRASWDESRPLTPWVYAIARRKLIDAARKRRRMEQGRLSLPYEEFVEIAAAPDGGLDGIGANVERHVAALPERQRQVVRALAVEGASVEAVAARLRISAGAVRVALHRGLATLANRIRMTDV